MTMKTIAVASLLATFLAARAAALSTYVPGEVLVKFRPGASAERRAAALALRTHAAVRDVHAGWAHVRLEPGQSVEAAVASYAVDEAVEYAQPNFVYRASAVPNDPWYQYLWALKNTGQTVPSSLATVQQTGGLYYPNNPGLTGFDIHVEPAWDLTTDCSGAVVAVLDTGVHHGHQDLAANMWDGGASYPNHGWDFVDGDDDPLDSHGHGTHVAATIGAVGHDGIGVAGVCWTARIMAVRVLDTAGMGTSVGILQGIDFAKDHGAKVINMSLGGGGGFDQAFADAIARAQNAGVLLVVAAGNENENNDTTPSYPCSFPHPNILCVAALDQRYQRADFSNVGAKSVDVGAPGTNILSAWPGAHAVAEEWFGFGWSSTTTTWGGWGLWSYGGSAFLANPNPYGVATYNAGTDDRYWRVLDLSGADVVSVELVAAVDLAPGDSLGTSCRVGGGDPFVGGTPVGALEGYRSGQTLEFMGIDYSACAGGLASIGFQLHSGSSSARSYGVAIAPPLTVIELARNATSYNTISGTSMATPVVAGVAALLRSYHPGYTYAEVVSAIKGGGRPVTALAGVTTSGKAVDAAASLAHLNPPTGLRAAVH